MKHVVVYFFKNTTEKAKEFLCSLNNSEVKELTNIFKQQKDTKSIVEYEIKFKGNTIHCLMQHGDRLIKVNVIDVEPIK